MKFVLDCSSAIQWEIPEADSAKAIALREGYRNGVHELIAPDIFPAEAGNALLVVERKGRIAPGQYPVMLADLLTTCPDLYEIRPLIPRTVTLIASVTTGFRVSFYDALYVALAQREGCGLVTGDAKLIRGMAGQYPFIIPLSSL